MVREGIERRLTMILAADVVGYNRLMAADEAGTIPGKCSRGTTEPARGIFARSVDDVRVSCFI